MGVFSGSGKAFDDLEKAWKAFPRGFKNLRVLVFNTQGQPVLQYSVETGASTTLDEKLCAVGTELTRGIYENVAEFSGSTPRRVAFFLDSDLITLQRNDPFILMVFWPPNSIKPNSTIDDYLARLSLTLQEELT